MGSYLCLRLSIKTSIAEDLGALKKVSGCFVSQIKILLTTGPFEKLKLDFCLFLKILVLFMFFSFLFLFVLCEDSTEVKNQQQKNNPTTLVGNRASTATTRSDPTKKYISDKRLTKLIFALSAIFRLTKPMPRDVTVVAVAVA